MSETLQRSVRKLGLVCLIVVVLAMAAAVPLHCLPVALRVGGGSLLAGAGLGLSMALVTRTRNPWLIYLGLLLGALTFVPLAQEWPPGDSWDIHPWHGAPPITYNYLDMLRMGLYLCGIPWPFARFGYHAPDPIPASPAITGASEDESESESAADSEKP